MAEEVKTETTLDPFVANIVKGFGNILPPEQEHIEPLPTTGTTIAETVAKTRLDKKEVKTEAKEEPKVETKEEVKTEAKVETKEEAKVEPKVEPKTVIKVVKVEPKVEPKVEVKQPTPEELRAQQDETEYVAGLTDGQRDELEIAKFNDSKKGTKLYTQLLDYYRKVDKFSEENPDATPESEEFIKFSAEQKPKWSNVDRRKAEREMIEEQAVRKAQEAVKPVLESNSRKVAALQVAPVIVKARDEVVKAMTEKAEGLFEIDPEVAEKVRAMPYAKAKEEFPIEAQIIHGTMNATEAYLKIVSGAVELNPQDPLHSWVAKFVAKEGQAMMNRPESERIVDGRRFVPMHEYDPSSTDTWTFTDDQIIRKMAQSGIEQYTNQVKQMEKSGFKRAPKVVTETKTEASASVNGTVSPKVSGGIMSGANDGVKTANPNHQFFRNLGVPEEQIPA